MPKIKLSEVQDIVENEIEAHGSLRGESGQSQAYEDGFLAGLEHIKTLLDEIEIEEEDQND